MPTSAPTNIYNRTQIFCTTGESVDVLCIPQQRVLPSPSAATAPDESVVPRRRRCSVALQKDSRVLAAMYSYGVLLWHRGTIRSASSVSFCILFLTSQKKYAAGGTVAVSPHSTAVPVNSDKRADMCTAPLRRWKFWRSRKGSRRIAPAALFSIYSFSRTISANARQVGFPPASMAACTAASSRSALSTSPICRRSMASALRMLAGLA